MSLCGKLAFITGAGSGIGRTTCQILARDGANVIAADFNLTTAKETIDIIDEKTRNHTFISINVKDSESVNNALKTIIDKYKEPPSIVVNCAGIVRDNFLLKMSEDDFQEVLDVNLKGTFLVIQVCAKAIIEHELKEASVINIGSVVGKTGNIGQANYCASKAGVELLTKTAARELGRNGIRVNAVLPGFIKTPMTDSVPEKVKEIFLKQIALSRLGQPKEIAEVISFLASDKSSYITGASIDVNGGFF